MKNQRGQRLEHVKKEKPYSAVGVASVICVIAAGLTGIFLFLTLVSIFLVMIGGTEYAVAVLTARLGEKYYSEVLNDLFLPGMISSIVFTILFFSKKGGRSCGPIGYLSADEQSGTNKNAVPTGRLDLTGRIGGFAVFLPLNLWLIWVAVDESDVPWWVVPVFVSSLVYLLFQAWRQFFSVRKRDKD